ncbi:Lysophospholipase L1 [Spirosomataceae bacterium TFI 002]|nr:Lysophospholipase L1 [Spirosomataceae bacterium TFI 002]
MLALFFLGTSFKSLNKEVRIFMIGDSTMANKTAKVAPETGWGQVLHELFTDEVVTQNHAVNGRSTKSFRDEGLWDKVESQLKEGDYVFIQFGHNDQKIKDPTRYSTPNTAYKANLKRYVEETKAKGAFPILLTPINRRKFDENGVFVDQHGEYPDAVRSLASEMNIPLIDMYAKSLEVLENLGVEKSKKLYMNLEPNTYPNYPNGLEDNTHFTKEGARVMAKLAVEGLVEIGSPLGEFLVEEKVP